MAAEVSDQKKKMQAAQKKKMQATRGRMITRALKNELERLERVEKNWPKGADLNHMSAQQRYENSQQHQMILGKIESLKQKIFQVAQTLALDKDHKESIAEMFNWMQTNGVPRLIPLMEQEEPDTPSDDKTSETPPAKKATEKDNAVSFAENLLFNYDDDNMYDLSERDEYDYFDDAAFYTGGHTQTGNVLSWHATQSVAYNQIELYSTLGLGLVAFMMVAVLLSCFACFIGYVAGKRWNFAKKKCAFVLQKVDEFV